MTTNLLPTARVRDLDSTTPDLLDLWIVERDMEALAEAMWTDPMEDHRD
jgi:hypothetical protein